MRAHAEAVGDGLEGFLLLVDAVAVAPPPGLVDKRPVSGIHQPDDAVVHSARQFGREIGDLVFVAEGGNARRWHRRLHSFCESCPSRSRLGYVDPDVVVVLFAGIAASVDAIYAQLLVCSQRRNELALAGMRFELPAMVTALHPLAVEPAMGKRHTAMWTGIMQSKRRPLDHVRWLEEFRAASPSADAFQ